MSKENVTSQNKYKITDFYKILDTIGEGTFGKVKSGIHILTGEKVAIKFLEKSKIKDKESAERVSREVTFLKKLKHGNIIQLYEIYENSTCIYLVMEFAKYGEFYNYIVDHTRLDEEEASMFYVQVLEGIEYIHKHKIVHRDLKPENLLLNENKTLKLIDFGLSNSYEKGNVLKTPCGSPCYAAPEMLIGKKYSGLEIDIWSSGIILYAMVCGYLPFEDDNNSELYKKIIECKLEFQIPLSDICIDLIKKLLIPNPLKRITIEEIKRHSFFIQGLELLKRRKIEYDQDDIDKLTFQRLEEMGFSNEIVLENLKKGNYNQVTTCYYLILNRIKYEKYKEIVNKRKDNVEESHYAEEILGTESPVMNNSDKRNEKDIQFFSQEENDNYNDLVMLSEESKQATPEIKKFIFNFEEHKHEYLRTDNNLQGSHGPRHTTCKTETNIRTSINKKKEISCHKTKNLSKKTSSHKKNTFPLSIKTNNKFNNINNITPFSNKSTKNNYINYNNVVIQNTNYNININNLSGKTPKQMQSKGDKNISIKPIQINIFNNNVNTPNQKKLNNNYVVVDYNINLTRPSSKSKKSNKSGDSNIKLKSLNHDSNKEIIRLYTSNSVNKKKINNQSDTFNINPTMAKQKPPSIEKIIPTSAKNVIQSMFSRLSINNISNNFHKISKHSDNLFFKRKTESSIGLDSVSPLKKTDGFKISVPGEKIMGLYSKKQSMNSNLLKKPSHPIKLSKVDKRLSHNVSGFESSNTYRGLNDSVLAIKDKLYSICSTNKIKIKKTDERAYQCSYENNVFKLEIYESKGKNQLKFSHLKGKEEITSLLYKRLFNI